VHKFGFLSQLNALFAISRALFLIEGVSFTNVCKVPHVAFKPELPTLPQVAGLLRWFDSLWHLPYPKQKKTASKNFGGCLS
jgi:hypothetical protein